MQERYHSQLDFVLFFLRLFFFDCIHTYLFIYLQILIRFIFIFLFLGGVREKTDLFFYIHISVLFNCVRVFGL